MIGTVRVVKEIEGKEVTVATMGENAMFGEVSMLLRSQKEGATASIVADTDVEIYALQIELVLQILESKPHLAEKLNRILAIKLARRLRDLNTAKKPVPPASKKASTEDVKKKSDEKDKKKEKKAEEQAAAEEKSLTPEQKFQKKFKLESSEVIIKGANNLHLLWIVWLLNIFVCVCVCLLEIECSVKGNMTMHGSLLISPNYLCADFGVFGFKLKEAMQFSAITEMKKNKKKDLDIGFDGKTVRLASQAK